MGCSYQVVKITALYCSLQFIRNLNLPWIFFIDPNRESFLQGLEEFMKNLQSGVQLLIWTTIFTCEMFLDSFSFQRNAAIFTR